MLTYIEMTLMTFEGRLFASDMPSFGMAPNNCRRKVGEDHGLIHQKPICAHKYTQLTLVIIVLR